jgi:hypothetical protein
MFLPEYVGTSALAISLTTEQLKALQEQLCTALRENDHKAAQALIAPALVKEKDRVRS